MTAMSKTARGAAEAKKASDKGSFSMVRRLLKAALPHLCLIMCLMLLVFFVIDQVNNHIGFMKNEFHKWLTLFLCIAVIAQSAMMISTNRKRKMLEYRRRLQKQRKAKG